MGKSVFKNRSFLTLILAKFSATLGRFIQITAFSLYVIDKTHSSILFASVLLAALVPKVVLGLFCGVIVDWVDRKRLLVLLDLTRGVLLVSIGTSIGSGSMSLWTIYVIAITLGILSAFDEPMLMTVIPSIVEPDDLETANSMNMIVLALGNLLGPILGVMIYSKFGVVLTLLVNGACFIFAAVVQMSMRIPTDNVTGEKRTISKFRSDFMQGILYIWNNRRMKTIILCIIIQNCFFNGATQVGIPFVSRVDLEVSNMEFAFIEMVVILGVVLGAAMSSAIKKNLTTDQLFVRMLTIIGVVFLCVGVIASRVFANLQINFYLILALYLVLGAASINVAISFQSELQKEVDNKFLGRISSMVVAFIMASVPIGEGLYGWLFNIFPSEVPFIVSSLVILIIAFFYRRAMKNNSFVSDGRSINESTLY